MARFIMVSTIYYVVKILLAMHNNMTTCMSVDCFVLMFKSKYLY